MSTASGSRSVFTSFVCGAISLSASASTVPLRDGSGSPFLNTFGRTVAICGRWFGVMMVAMMLPPNAGRVWCRSICSAPVSLFFVSSTLSIVQSAVRPVRTFTATRAKNARPTAVAPARITSGLCFSTSCATAST